PTRPPIVASTARMPAISLLTACRCSRRPTATSAAATTSAAQTSAAARSTSRPRDVGGAPFLRDQCTALLSFARPNDDACPPPPRLEDDGAQQEQRDPHRCRGDVADRVQEGLDDHDHRGGDEDAEQRGHDRPCLLVEGRD